MKKLFKIKLLPFSVPQIDKNIIMAVFKSIFFFKVYKGPEIGAFEKEFAKYIGVKHAICFSSARYSLYLIYKYFDCKDKDILFPAYTCIPALDALRWAGAKPYFLDIDLNTYNPRFESNLLNPKNIGAVSLSFLYGLVGDIDGFLEFGRKNNIPVIEDAAIALGSSYKGRKIGTLGDAAVFSLQSSKILTSWKGGVITTNNEGLYRYLSKERDKLPYPSLFKLLFNVFLTCFRRALSNPAVYGLTAYPMKRITFSKFLNKIINYLVDQNPNEAITGRSSKEVPNAEMARFTNLQAAMALASFQKIDSILSKRNHIADLYNSGLMNNASVKIPTREANINHAYGRYPIRVPGISKFVLQDLFFKYGVETSEYYPYICPDTYFMKGLNLKHGKFLNAKIASQETILLPMHVFLREKDVLNIIRLCNNMINGENNQPLMDHEQTNRLSMNPVTLLTREIRTRVALRYIPQGKVHADIGCGREKYLLKKSPCAVKIGLDKQIGNFIEKEINLSDKSIDCITMLAAIEHFDYPQDIVKECHRILKDDGVLIITTPKEKGLWITNLYSPNFEKIEGPHKQHFDYMGMQKLAAGLFNITLYKTFALGYNQLFICKKLQKENRC